MSEINKIASEFLRDYLRGAPTQKVYCVDSKKPVSCYGEDAKEFLDRMRKEFKQATKVQEVAERIEIDELATGAILMFNSRVFVGFLTSPNGNRRPVFTHNFNLAKVFTTELDISFAQIELLTYGIGAERRPSLI